MPRIVIIGAGFGGLAAAIELKKAGHTDLTIVEKATQVGGVWRENSYPGAGCDVPSPLYSFSHRPNPHWPWRYSRQAEILQYLQDTAFAYDLRPHLRLGTEVTEATHVDGRWVVRLAGGEVLEADVLVPALGQLSRPAFPDIPGQYKFQGHHFHSAIWDHNHDLTGKRVAVIGTGASSIQFVPQIAKVAGNVTVFQRSAAWIVPKPEVRYPRWQQSLYAKLPFAQRVERNVIWGLVEFLNMGMTGSKTIKNAWEWQARRHMRKQVPDPELRAKLTPDYEFGCKRVLFSNNYLPTMSLPTVDLVTDKITEITETGVLTSDGVQHEFDVIIYGTGFSTQDFLGSVEIKGTDGSSLREVWARGAHAYLGMAVPKFPNMFLMYGPNTNLGAGSIIFMLERQARYIRKALRAAKGRALEVRPEVSAKFDAEMQQRLGESVWARCDSWYRNSQGRVVNNWPGLVTEYARRLFRFRRGDYQG
ncbi:NAD(P)/FAD-dependent oxidoreductase [Pseudonocardiaceae bacterium YIM PH 21723]|nr:NAD(P)/FAD-dependent oxidoreductase [Pseudonocardiaceae bacterium YIM PH 21723]